MSAVQWVYATVVVVALAEAAFLAATYWVTRPKEYDTQTRWHP